MQQQQSALRSIYNTAGHTKPKHAAVVLPILDQVESIELNANQRADSDGDMRHARSSKNWRNRVHENSVPQDDDGDEEANKSDNDEETIAAASAAAGCVLQKKSAQYEIPHLATMRLAAGSSIDTVGHSNNQDSGVGAADSHDTVQKFAVLGLKQKWRRGRSVQRARGLTQTIAPVDDTAVNSGPDSGLDIFDNDDDVDLENPRFSVRESFSSSSHDSEQMESEQSTGRGSSFSSRDAGADDRSQRFVVTRQKKSKFVARIHLPGGQNPLYLGRYNSEAAALAACERAFSVVTTPRK